MKNKHLSGIKLKQTSSNLTTRKGKEKMCTINEQLNEQLSRTQEKLPGSKASHHIQTNHSVKNRQQILT